MPSLASPVLRILLALARSFPLAFLASMAMAGTDEAPFRIGGLLFGDLYHIPSHHTEAGDGATGGVLRRAYLTANFDLGATWYGRARIEVNQSGEFETYDFEADFKDLYVARKFGRHELMLGLSPTLTFDLIESAWGARYLMRTPMDLQGVASRDTGVSLKGPLNREGTLGYRAMIGSGVEFGAESGDGRKLMIALTWKPSPSLYIDLYLDHEKLAGSADRTTLQAFTGYKSEAMRWGIQYSHQDREIEPRLELASAFIIRKMQQRLSLIARLDRVLEPSPKGDNISYIPFDPSAPATMLLSGLEYRFTPTFRITPNIIWTFYDRNDLGMRPEDDVHIRLTFFLDLE